MSFRVHSSEDRVIVELEGGTSVQHAAELHRELLAAGAPSRPVRVKAQTCGDIDITIVQLLAALETSCPELKIEQASDEFLAALDRAGMRRHLRSALREEKADGGGGQ